MIHRKTIRKALLILACTCAFMVAATAVELVFMRLEAATLKGRLIFLLLLNLNVMALLGLMYHVGKRIFRLAVERKKGILGHKFRTKVVAFFVILISIPSGMLFVIASELGTNYIDRFFTPQFKRPIESSLAIAQEFYDMERRRTLQYAEMARQGRNLPQNYTVSYMDEMSDDASAAVRAAFDGRNGTEVISSAGGDTLRAALPLGPSDPRGEILVVDTTLSADISRSIEQIKTSYEDFVQLEAWKFPLKLNYLLLLSFFTLIIIFAGMWVSLRIAGWITDPIRSLAHPAGATR
jgi:two-component system nitrogen regulation sensor histidine kinase NtrY